MLQFRFANVDTKATESLRQAKRLPATNKGDLHSAVLSAAHYALARGHTMYVYVGNSYNHTVWRVSDKPQDYLCPINNTGRRIISISSDLEVCWHDRY